MASLFRLAPRLHTSKSLFASVLRCSSNVSDTHHHRTKVLPSSAAFVSYSTFIDDESRLTMSDGSSDFTHRSSNSNTGESVRSRPSKRIYFVPSDDNFFKSCTKRLIDVCLWGVRNAKPGDFYSDQIRKALHYFASLKDRGVKIEETLYGDFMLHLCHNGLVEDFFVLHKLIRDSDPDVSRFKLAYYEMRLWEGVNNLEKIQELCRFAMDDSSGEKSCVKGYLLQALGDTGRKEQFLMLLDGLVITKVTNVVGIFRCLGKLELEDFAYKYIVALRLSGFDIVGISNLIYEYGISIPDFPAEDVGRKVRDLHLKFKVPLTTALNEKLSKDSHAFSEHESGSFSLKGNNNLQLQF